MLSLWVTALTRGIFGKPKVWTCKVEEQQCERNHRAGPITKALQHLFILEKAVSSETASVLSVFAGRDELEPSDRSNCNRFVFPCTPFSQAPCLAKL